MKTVFITGSSGLVGSTVAAFFHARGFVVHGIDNNQRAVFLGPRADTRWMQRRLVSTLTRFHHHELDIRNRAGILRLLQELQPACIVHAAAQPSHDRAAAIPFEDFDTNAGGTMNLLEAARRACPEAPFIHLSTNKVYGDRPNSLCLVERESRWDFADPAYANGIPESLAIDQALHSLFGASKAAADLLVQEYGRYFSMPTCCLRCGCITGPHHAGVELHGFLSYLAYCNLAGEEYRIFGYKGKQVRDNIHAEDVARFAYDFFQAPRVGAVYNLGGGKDNSCSILEAFALVEAITGKAQRRSYDERHRVGDHICYYSDLGKVRQHFPGWRLTRGLPQILEEIVRAWREPRDV